MMEFVESGLNFRLADNNCFRIEKHSLALKHHRHSSQNIKACEFISFIKDRMVFVEAKSSAPLNTNGKVEDLMLNGVKMPDNWTAYDNYTTFLRNITKKFVDSYNILRAISEGRHGIEERKNLHLPSTTVDNENIEFVLILNLPSNAGNVKRESLSSLRDALTNEMRPFLSIWRIPSDAVKVCWPEQAQTKYNFLVLA